MGTLNVALSFCKRAETTGIYFFRIVPIVPVNSTYNFIIVTSSAFVPAEPDDNRISASVHTVPFTVNQTIDNSLDADWFKFTIGNNNITTFSLSNVPTGAVYGLILYDANLNPLASFASSGSDSRTWQLPGNSTDYAEIFSVNGVFSATQYYRLSVSVQPPPYRSGDNSNQYIHQWQYVRWGPVCVNCGMQLN